MSQAIAHALAYRIDKRVFPKSSPIRSNIREAPAPVRKTVDRKPMQDTNLPMPQDIHRNNPNKVSPAGLTCPIWPRFNASKLPLETVSRLLLHSRFEDTLFVSHESNQPQISSR